MKKIIILMAIEIAVIFLLLSCNKENIVPNQLKTLSTTSIDNGYTTPVITFSSNIIPLRAGIVPTDHYLMGDTFNVSQYCTTSQIVITVTSFNINLSSPKLFIDGQKFASFITDSIPEYTQIKYIFNISKYLSIGNHLLEFRGSASGNTGAVFYAGIYDNGFKALDEGGNFAIVNTPVIKYRRFR